MFVLLLILRQVKPALWKVHFGKPSCYLHKSVAPPPPKAVDGGAYVEDVEVVKEIAAYSSAASSSSICF